jgi:predicted Fe-Mo cluster-binding NifX family protein
VRLCFPVAKNEGLDSQVFGHFGSAPLFLVVDAEEGRVVEVVNRDLHHSHGACSPVKALGGHAVDAVVVGGIGGGALRGLSEAGIRVFEAGAPTVSENVALAGRGGLAPWGPGRACGGHGHSHGCGHRGP